MQKRPIIPTFPAMQAEMTKMAKTIRQNAKDTKASQKAFDTSKDEEAKQGLRLKLKEELTRSEELKQIYRHFLIAYSELRGKTRTQVEFPPVEKKGGKQKPIAEIFIAYLKMKYGERK